jgi:NAD(P)H-dependent flavin oxidoreductase YrpB (nitropropane dioxygenase family)
LAYIINYGVKTPAHHDVRKPTHGKRTLEKGEKMEWTTRITRLLGCKYPILEGAYHGLGTWKFAAAVADTGAFGLITASVYKTPEKLRKAIRDCRDKTGGAFGVNLSIGICPRIDEMLEICIEEGVPVETAAYKPDVLAPRIKEGGIPWIHKSARVPDAIHAEKLGADAVIVVGLEGVGFKNPEQLPIFIATTMAKREVKVPFIAAGGIGDAAGFMGALGMGADAIMMGTAFMATDECPLGKRAKEKMVKSSPYDLRLRNQVLSSPDLKAYGEVMENRDKMPLDKWLRMLERLNLKDPNWQKDIDPSSGNTLKKEWGEGGSNRLVSLAIGVIDSVVPVKDFVEKMVHDAEALIDGFEFLKKA